MKLGWMALIVSGCVFHVTDEGLGGGDPEVSLGMEPDSLESGRTLATITDAYMEADFRDVWEVRSMGDFTVVEWEGSQNRLDVVVDVEGAPEGEQQVAIELGDQTAFVTFTVR